MNIPTSPDHIPRRQIQEAIRLLGLDPTDLRTLTLHPDRADAEYIARDANGEVAMLKNGDELVIVPVPIPVTQEGT